MAILEPQPLVTGVAHKKPVYHLTVKEIIHFFISTNSVRTGAEIGKKYEQIKKTLRVGSLNTENYTAQLLHGMYK